jgi:tRNA nucleotidyltransferase (CCA-adding enzyme)
MVSFDVPPFVSLIVNRLLETGHLAYIVGGALRDAYLKRPITDWDVTTSASPEEVGRLFGGIRRFALKQGTVTLIHAGTHYEVTTFRGKKDSLDEDLSRRDFTMNAMAYDLSEERILDPYGGRRDMEKRRVRAVGKPEHRFQEDPLRLLRAVRFATELAFRIETETLRTLPVMASQLSSVAPERIREELVKVLMGPKPSKGIHLMVRTGLLKAVLPELLESYGNLEHALETVDCVERNRTLRLAALFHDLGKPRVRKNVQGKWHFKGHEGESARLAQEIMLRLRFSKEVISRVVNLIRHHCVGYDPGWTDGSVRRFIRRVGQDNVSDLLSLRRADIVAAGLGEHELFLLSQLESRVRDVIQKGMAKASCDLTISGLEVMQVLGLSPGPEVGRILKELLERVTDDPDMNTPEHLRARLRQMKTKWSPPP